jgi:PAS domain S-box-containing protein
MDQEPNDASQALPLPDPAVTVVAIDDDAAVLLLIARSLQAEGITCRTAASGAEGLRLIRESPPDLVLLDIVMVGEDGFTICREIRRAWSPDQLPVVMVTSLEDLASIQAAYQAGANDFLTKPLHWRHLPYRIRHVLQASRALKALQDSIDRYQRISAAITDYIYTVRIEGGRAAGTTHGPGCLAVTGYRPDEFANDSFLWYRMVADKDRPGVLEQARRILAGEDPPPIEHRIRHKNGTLRWVRNTFVPHCDAAGTLVAYDGLVQDITGKVETELERRRLQEERQHSEKLESLGSLAGGIAHDMNNVLAAIMGMASALRATCTDHDLRARPLDSILHASSRGRDLVKGLSDFARKGLEEIHRFDLNELLRKEAELLGHARTHQVQLALDLDPLPWILGDASALGSAIMNLGINALDAMPEGGTLSFKSRALAAGGIELTVQDTGCGMPPEVLARAMEPFFTTKPVGKGTGLGLARVYGTMKAHGGSVELHSEPGQGTSVRLLFPAGAATPGPPDPAADPRAVAGPRALSVLLVDDDDLIQSSTQALLEIMGHTTVAASSGEEALARLEAGLRPDVVLLDMNMPGLGGAGTLPRLRVLRPDLPVLLATGRVDQSALDLVQNCPHVKLLSKPFSLKELRHQLESLGCSI